jgi:hypothetical protein
VSVPSAKVNLISGDSTSTKSQFYSMRVDGLGGGVFWKADTITARKYFEGTKPFTVELWARVDRNIKQTNDSSKRSWPMLADAADNFSIMVQPDLSDDSKYEVVMRTPGAGTTLFEDTHTGIIVNPNQYYHYTLSTNGSGTWTMRVVVGDSLQSKTVTGKRAVKWNTAKPAVSFGTNISNDSTYTMKGFIDDVRIWTKELTNKEVLANYNRILGGAETDLKLYWPFDEGINKQQTAYDYSKTGGVANGNHGQLASGSSVSTVVPSADQLSLYGLTDEYGNYVIRGVPFTGEGTNYIVKPVKGVHAFSPQQSTRFVSSSSLNFSGVDFTDVSSFTVKGVVYYKNTDYPVADANFYVDGTICSKKGVACISDQYGKFEISVPVGDHYIQIKKDGHVFVNNGRYPSDPNNVGTLYTFVDSLSNMTFYDSTLVVVAGRVCGGDIEKAKPLGMGLSTNNVGTATIILTAGSSSPYRLNVDVVKSGTIFRYDNGADPIEVASPTKDVNSKTIRMSGLSCKLISITTDKNTGEFAALLPPLNYSVSSIKVPGKNSTTVTLSTSDLSTINASSPLKTSTDTFKVAKDTVKVLKDSVKRFTYCASMKKVIYNEPTFEVTQVDAPEGRFGEPSISYRAANMAKPVTILAYDKNGYKFGSPSDTTCYPIFKEFNTYKFKVKAYEQYVNYENNLTTTVPLQNVEVTTVNEMSSIQKVYVDTGTVKSSGQFVKAGDFVTLEDNKFTLDSLGTAVYEWVAGFPNILDPYTRAINMSFVQNKKTYNWKLGNATGLEGIVLGTLPSGNDFVTKGPDKVLMVLRDPPGTGSTASWEAGTTTTSTVTSEGFIDTTIGETAEADLGTELTTIDGTPGFGVITSVKHKESVTASLKTDVKYTGSNTKTYTTTTLRKISTSGEVDFVGAKGDVFVGNATNILFGNERKVGIQKDTQGNYFIGRTDVLTTGSTFGTEFMYTQNYVEQTLLPNLLKVRNSMLIEVTDTANYVNYTDSAVFITMLKPGDFGYGSSNYDKDTWGPDANVNTDQTYGPSYKMVVPKNRPDTTTVYQDKIQWYNLQIATWKQVLANNEMAKVTAIENHDKWFDKNYSIDSGTAFESSVTNDTTTSHTNSTEWNTVISAAYGNETKISGVGVTFTDNVEVNTGGHWSDDTGTTHTTTTSYSIVETGDDDSHTFDVYKAPDGFGAIFVTRGGRTSCPYEGQEVTKYYKPGTEINAATSQIEMPFIKAKNPVITDVPSGTKATFMLQLSNLSETGENVFFDLKPLSTDAKKGASLTLSTGPLGDGHAFLVNAEDTLNVMLQLSQMQTSVLDYDHIGLVLVSQCQKDPTGANKVISDTCYISAHFVPTSSDITLNIDKTTMNMFTSDTLAMSIRDYDANFNGLKAIRIQYKGERDVNWNLAKEYVVNKAYLNEDNELLPSGGIVNFNFPMSNTSTFPDQTYQFRAITVSLYGSENVTKASSTILVVKDMAPPRLLGYAKPTNGILNKGDEISVVFNEAIKGSQLTDANNFIITGVLNESTIAHNVGLKLDGTDRAAYTEADVQLAGKSFAVDTWVNYHGAGTIFSHGHGTSKFTAGTDAEGHLVMNIGGSTYTSAKTIPQNKWVFLTFNYTNDTQCTLNAMTAFDAETVTLFNNEPVVAYTGLGNITVGSKLNGAIQEMTLWDRARSMAEAQGDMYKTKAASTPYLIGYWKFDEGEGVKAADLARSRNMVLPVANWYLNNVNKAVTLDGKSYVALDITACSALATDDYAFEMWFRGKTKAESTLFSVGEKKLSVGFDSSGLLQLISDGAITQLGTNDYLNNAWHHLALNVLRNGNAIVYVDGTAVKQVAASQVEALAGNAINLGAIRYLDGTGTYAYKSYFTGQVDEVRFWKATLSANALRANRLLRLNGKEAGLVAYYPFEKKSLDAANQVVAKGSEVDAVSDSIKAISNAALTYTDEAPSLKVAPTETNVSYSYVASDNSIVLTLNESPAKLEGCTINFTVRNVEDANANVCEPIHWSAYVSQNRLKWENSGTSIKQKSLEETTFTAKITNKGASTENWTLNNLPDWLTADATSGLLPALTDKTITFTVNSSTPIGKYEETIYLSGNDEINEPFTVNLNVTGDEPDWTVNPKAYENSMNVIGQLQIANIPSEDTSDKIAAFIDGECRGVASPVYYPRYDSYYTIMNVYGNGGEKGDAGKTIVFKVWDASTGTIYPFVTTSYAASFTANQVLGSSANPYIWNAQKVVEQDIDLAQGWNWISLFANSTDMTVSTLLSNIKSSTNTIKSKTSFAVPDTGKVWGGELTRLYVGDMYKLKSTKSVVFSMVGEVVKAVDEPVTIHDGWNWIGYNANYNVSVADAFAELSPTDGDQVKDQYDFAVYQGYAWMGTLKVLAPGRGYMYKSAYNQDRLFHYPSKASTSISSAPALEREMSAFTTVSANAYPGNMTMVAKLVNGSTAVSGAEVGVFANDGCRSAEVSNSDGIVFLTIAGEGTGAPLTFKVYNGGKTTELDQGLIYTDDATYGTMSSPYLIQLDPTAIDVASAERVHIYPTRIVNDVKVDAGSAVNIKRIMVQDTGGRILLSRENGLTEHNVIPMSGYADGIYFIVVETSKGNVVKRVLK